MRRLPLRPSLVLSVLALGLLIACSGEAQTAARCGNCGMHVDASGLSAGATAGDGSSLAFDSAKCLFRYALAHAEVRDAWVTDYYTRAHRPATTAVYVLGSDVYGAMGPDLIAVGSPEDAARFSRDHHGASVLARDEVTAAVIDALFGSPPR